MNIFLTGATGLIGAHTALALLNAGHNVRMLVRDTALASSYFKKHGFENCDFVQGDMRDKAAMQQAIHGVDAVFHAAAMVSLDPKKAQEVYQANIASIDAVVGTAHELGVKNIVYVSSLGALFRPEAASVNENSPLGNLKEAYSKSKRDCEAHVRTMQEKGVPVQITYPSGTFSPDDPKLNESNHSLTTLLKVVPQIPSGIQCIDARDMAEIHRKMLETPPQGDFTEARFIVAGHFYTWAEFHQLLESVTGRKIFAPWVPGWLMRFFGKIGDIIKKIHPIDTPVSSESMALVTQWPTADSSKVCQRFAMQFRPGAETFSDTINWLTANNHLDAKLAGKCATKTQATSKTS
jgi:nucleoside-diphosphate-sugar epimerase